MRKLLLITLTSFILCLFPHTNFGQAPNLGAASGFALFTATGAFSNNGATVVNGDIGTNVGAFTGFPPGVVNGQIHVADVISAQAASAVDAAYGSMSTITCGQVIGTTLGNGQILTPNVYCLGGASVLNGNLILDGQCDPDALFIFKINGALSTNSISNIILINNASICNIYWQINGAVELGDGSTFKGTILANGAIELLEGASLLGRGLTRQGAIALHNNTVDTDMQPTASVITAGGATTFCAGGSVTLTGNCGGVWSNGATTPSITVTSSGNYSVTNSNDCGSATSNHIIVTVVALPVCTITGNAAICLGQSTVLCAPAGATSYLWSTGITTNCITVSTAGTFSVTVTNATGCSSVCSRTVVVNPLPVCTITGNLSICAGQTTQLCAPAGAASYLWSNGATTNCTTVSSAGTYGVTVTNATGCSSICSAAVIVSPAPICTITGNLSICAGQTTQLCVPAGAASYLWSTGSTTNCITVSTPGTYGVTVTNAAGCSSICSAAVIVSPAPVCTITGNLSICAGQTTQLCAPAGAASYLWTNGATTNCINVSTAGTYAVTVTNAAGCSSICSAAVLVSPAPICTITGNLSICQGQTTQLCVPAGAASYLWSSGATTNCIMVSAAGTYTVTVTNAAGCSSICSAAVLVSPAPICTISGDLSICQGQTTQLCVPAGAASYLWSNGATTNCITVNAAGTYAVTVTNTAGCSSICSAAVLVSPLPICNISGNLSICQGQTTQLCVPAGATSYLWSNGAVTNCITVSAAGTYNVTVTNAGGCSSICSATVVLTPLPICTITGNTFICDAGQTTQLCVPAGATSYLWSNGAITNCITVGAGSYSVTVTNGTGCSSVCSTAVTINPQPVCNITGDDFLCEAGQTTQICVPSGATAYLWNTGATTNCITVGAGTYSVTVTNTGGCTSVCSKTVILNPTPTCTITGNNIICLGQSTQLCVPAGAASYLWSNGATTNCITVSAAGTYAVTVTNANGCSSICSIAVTVNPLPVCTITGNLNFCVGQTTQLCVPAGAASYLWSTGATTNCISVNAAGTYSVTVTNVSGCSSICSATVAANPLPVCTITGNLSFCPGQSTQLCVPAGAASYLWSTGALTNCITVNAAGTYSVTVTNAGGCSSICSATVTVNPLPVCTITGNLSFCQGQSTQLCVPPGAASYLWSTGATTNCISVNAAGTYSVTVTNTVGCSSICSETVTVNPIPVCTISGNNFVCAAGQTTQLCVPPGAASYLWSTGATTNCITVGAGNYSVTVTGENGCSSVCNQSVTINPQPSCTITGDNFLCEQGQTTQLCVPPGAASYLWSTGATTNCISVNATGTYTVTVTYASGCSSICSETVTLNPLPNCTITGDDFICQEGQLTQLCVPAGAASYLWNTGATTNCIIASAAGTYSVTITNANGCSSVCSKTIILNPQSNCTITGDDFICEAGQFTQLCVNASSPSTYLWSNGATTSCITVGAGTYFVTVTNASGCSSICSKTVALNPLPNCTITGDYFICAEGQTAMLCVPAGAASYLWSTGDTTNCILVSAAGTYSVTVTNTNGCSSICSKTITVNPQLSCTITCDDVICEGQSTLLCVPAGAASYLWSTGDTTNCITVSVAGTYSITVTYAGGCTSVCSRTITVSPQPGCAITGNCSIVCGGQPTQLCAPPGCANYVWCTGATTSCIWVSTAGNYCVTVTNAAGCSSVCCITVTGGPAPACEITGNCNIPCGGQPTQLCAPPGCASYLWSNGATTSCIWVSTAGNYCVTVTNAYGCSSVCSRIVTTGSTFNCEITGNCTLPCGGQPTLLCAPPGCASYWWSTGATTSCIAVNTPGNYCVTVTNANGCSSVCSRIVTSEVAPVCVIAGNCSLPCNGQPTLLCAPSGCASYWWNTGATTSCIIASEPGNYCVTVTNANGCSSSSCVTVTQAALPPGNITGDSIICGGQPALLCAPSGCASYWWSTGASTSCIIASQPGEYAVTVTNASGCSNRDTFTVVEIPEPSCNITGNLHPVEGQSTVLCAPADMRFYHWNTGDTTRCITVDAEGLYAVTITNAGGCSDSCNTNVISFTSEEAEWETFPGDNGNLLVQAYPNPFYDHATIEFQNTESDSHVVLELCKLTGNRISTLFDRDVEQGKLYKVELPAQNLAEGVYICRIVNGDQIINKKLILIR